MLIQRCTYVGEEDSRDTTAGVLTLCVTLSSIVTTCQASSVAGHGVLVSLDAAILSVTVSPKTSVVVLQETSNFDALVVPAEG